MLAVVNDVLNEDMHLVARTANYWNQFIRKYVNSTTRGLELDIHNILTLFNTTVTVLWLRLTFLTTNNMFILYQIKQAELSKPYLSV